MTDYQAYLLIGSSATLILTALGWLLTWVKGIASRTAVLEIELAVLKARLEERE